MVQSSLNQMLPFPFFQLIPDRGHASEPFHHIRYDLNDVVNFRFCVALPYREPQTSVGHLVAQPQGQQQRVAIARALVSKPAIVLADEPTGNLDSKTSADVLGLLKTTSQKFHQTLVMITHNSEIAQLADRIIRIEDGKIVQ